MLTILAYITHHAGLAFVLLAWVFVVLRLMQAGVHVTNNKVPLRGAFFGASALVLAIMWADVHDRNHARRSEAQPCRSISAIPTAPHKKLRLPEWYVSEPDDGSRARCDLRRVKKFDRKHDIPYLAGYSQDGKTIYIDRHMPRSFKYRGPHHRHRPLPHPP